MISVKGSCCIEVNKERFFLGQNLVLNQGKSILAWPFSSFSLVSSFTFVFGTSAATVNENQNGLQSSPVALNWNGAVSVTVTKPESKVLQIKGSYVDYADTQSATLKECSLLYGTTGVSRILIPDLELILGDNLDITWRLKYEV